MRRVPLTFLREGSIIARSIYDKDGRILLAKGTEINKKLIKLLTYHNILSAYIIDKYSPNSSSDIISESLRIKSIIELKNMASNFINDGAKSGYDDVKYNYFNKIKDLVIEIVDELLSKDVLLIEGIDIRNVENYYFSHSVNVAVLSIILGIELEYSKDKLVNLGIAAFLHDIGLVFLPAHVLYKTSNRNSDEEKIFRTHCEKGYSYLCKFEGIDEEVLEPILCHHEKIDGNGYPNKRNNKEISEFSKIISLVDFYDELMSTGIILQENLPHNVLEQIMAYVGSSFKYELVHILYKKTIPFLKGIMIKLNNGDIALVEGTVEGFPLRPIVRILKSKDNTKINKCINLAENLTISIDEIVYYL